MSLTLETMSRKVSEIVYRKIFRVERGRGLGEIAFANGTFFLHFRVRQGERVFKPTRKIFAGILGNF